MIRDPLLVAADEAALIQLARWQAEHVSRDLWRVTHGRAHWTSVTLRSPAASSSALVVGGGSVGSMRAAYVDVVVPAAARLGIDDHLVRVWRGDLRRAWGSLKRLEELAFEDWLNRERHSSVFRLVGAAVRRNDGVSEELARAALKLLAAGQARRDDREVDLG